MKLGDENDSFLESALQAELRFVLYRPVATTVAIRSNS